jgi:hypothetical protein
MNSTVKSFKMVKSLESKIKQVETLLDTAHQELDWEDYQWDLAGTEYHDRNTVKFERVMDLTRSLFRLRDRLELERTQE